MDCLDVLDIMDSPCDKYKDVKVTGITESNGKLIITLDDKHYLEADKSLLDLRDLLAKAEVDELKARIEALENKEDKDTIFDPTDIETKLKKAEDALEAIRNNLVEIGNAKDEVTHKAFNKNFTL